MFLSLSPVLDTVVGLVLRGPVRYTLTRPMGGEGGKSPAPDPPGGGSQRFRQEGGSAVRSRTHLLLGLVQLDGDVPLEARVAGAAQHPEAGDHDGVQHAEAHADHSVPGETGGRVFRESERLDLLVQN